MYELMLAQLAAIFPFPASQFASLATSTLISFAPKIGMSI